MNRSGIVHQPPRWNPGLLIGLAVLMLPFALKGHTKGLIIAVIVWVVVAALLVRWWRARPTPARRLTRSERPFTGRCRLTAGAGDLMYAAIPLAG